MDDVLDRVYADMSSTERNRTFGRLSRASATEAIALPRKSLRIIELLSTSRLNFRIRTAGQLLIYLGGAL
jgi:hypothetical protein